MPKDAPKFTPQIIARLLGMRQLDCNTKLSRHRKDPKYTEIHAINIYTQEMIDRLQEGKIKKIPSIIKPYIAVVCMKLSGYSEDDVIDFWRDEEGKLLLFISETTARDEFYKEGLHNKFTGVTFDTRVDKLNYLKRMRYDKYKEIRKLKSNQ